MNIDELNNENRIHMVSETRSDVEFKWDDEGLMDILLKQFDELYPVYGDPDDFVNNPKYLSVINKYIRQFNKNEISEKFFIKSIEKSFDEILSRFDGLKYQYKYDINYYKNDLNKAHRLLISGDGGIGKSYFLFKLSEKLKELSKEYLCIYCKYTKSIPDEIMNVITSKENEFYLIIDAFNELEEKEQEKMFERIKELSNKSNINIIISYRTNNLDSDIQEKLEKVLKNKYLFTGVEYESSISRLIETYGVEVTKFTDVLETNNALYLKMIDVILKDPKIKKEKIGDLVQVTFILEHYIQSIDWDCWNYTKKIGEYLFENNKSTLSENEIKNILADKADEYIDIMMRNNIIDFYMKEDEKEYVYRIQRLIDYIIARSLLKKITGLNTQEVIYLVNEKLSYIPSLAEPFIILLFDRYKEKDIGKAIEIIFNSELNEKFDLSTLRKVTFSKEQIEAIQQKLNINSLQRAFVELGGYHNRPFNCSNYITSKLIDNKPYKMDLLLNSYDNTYLMKLKSILYSIIFIETDTPYIEEAFWYSFWLTSSTNSDVKNMAIKVLFDITDKHKRYSDVLMEYYCVVDEYYIRKSIIRVLTSIGEHNKKIITFLEKILEDKDQIDSEIICRISKYLNKDTDYILLDKRNLYEEINENDEKNNDIDFKHILFVSDAYEKHLVQFENGFDEEKISMFYSFITNNKMEIYNWNKNLNVKFSCVNNGGECKYGSDENSFKSNMPKIDIIQIDSKKLFFTFKKIFLKVCSEYNYKYSEENEKFDVHFNKFENSILRKIISIAQDLLLGSLMCNYYTEEFSIYNDDKTFGYKVYEPIYIDDEELRINTPVSIYFEDIDRLNDIICKRLDLYGGRDENWYKDVELSIKNLKKLREPILYGGNEWSLISADIHKYESDNDNNHLYTETYDWNIVIDSKEELTGDGETKKKTIDCDYYYGSIDRYVNSEYSKPSKLKSVVSYSTYFKDTHMRLPPTSIIKDLDLKYDRRYSIWKSNENGDAVIYCDNNNREYFKYPITGAIYIRTDYLNTIIKKHNVKYWAYTEKSFMNKGWNEDASLHIELDSNGSVIKSFKNNNLNPVEREEVKEECKKCKFGIYQRHIQRNIDYTEIMKSLVDFEWDDE